MKDRLMIVEDQFISMICALSAFDGIEVEVGNIHGTVEGGLKMIDEFQPTMALLDIHLADNGRGTDIGKVLSEKNIPYLYVTGVGENPSHNCIDAVEIQDSNFKTIERFEGCDKNPEIWRRGFEILKAMLNK